MKRSLSDGKVIALRVFVLAGLIGAILFALTLAAAPQLHARIHQPIGTSHECAVTLIATGKYQLNEAPVLVSAPQPVIQFSKIPALSADWVPAPFLGASILEHAPPAHS